MPPYVAGLSVIRGTPVLVIDTGALIGVGGAASHTRFVVVRAGERPVALGVEAVLGVRALASGTLQELPSLLRDENRETFAAVGVLDAELLVVLGAARLVPASLWEALRSAEGAS
jgi:purine-binding chemotaxis protein CheW